MGVHREMGTRARARFRRGSVAFFAFALLAIQVHDAEAQNFFVINNGLAPPEPTNVIDEARDPDDRFIARNVGCPPEGGVALAPCPSPGTPTVIEIAAGAVLGGGTINPLNDIAEQAARDSSMVLMTGGTAGQVAARESGRIRMTGGTITFALKAFNNAEVIVLGGEVGGYIEAWNDAKVRIVGGSCCSVYSGVTSSSSESVIVSGGSLTELNEFGDARTTPSYIVEGNDFTLDGAPVDYGDYFTGGVHTVLAGTWESGESFSTTVYATWFRLAPPSVSVPTLSPWLAVALSALLLAIAVAALRGRRVST